MLSLEVSNRKGLLLLLILLLFVLLGEKVHNTSSDPRGTLLVSEAIVKHGTIRLDHLDAATIERYGYVFYQKNGHFYNYFPLGSAVLSVPVVAIANLAGIEMVQHEPIAQMVIVALISGVIISLLFATARLFVSLVQALWLTGVAWFGSAYASTLGTALWSHDFAVMFATLSLYLVLHAWCKRLSLPWAWLGASLFLAYFCRPTLLLLVPFLLAFMFIYDWRAALKTACVFALYMAGFVAFSWHEFGQLLPDYYQPKRLGSDTFGVALFGNLFSPARGLLVYTPILLLVLALIPLAVRRQSVRAPLLLLALAWPVAHWIIVSRFPHWWAGWSYGARLMVDVLPGLWVGVFAVYGALAGTKLHKAVFVFAVLTGTLAIAINTAHGLFNKHAILWNAEPNIDQHPALLFDWRYPPFLHTARRQRERLEALAMDKR